MSTELENISPKIIAAHRGQTKMTNSVLTTFEEFADKDEKLFPWERSAPPGLDNKVPDFWKSMIRISYGVLGRIFTRVAVVFMLTVLLVLLNKYAGWSYPQYSSIGHTLIGFALSMLLVFKTNSCHDRYKRAANNWAMFNQSATSFVRLVSNCKTHTIKSGDHIVKVLEAYVICVKHLLRDSKVELERKELETVLLKPTVSVLMEFSNRPLALQKLLSAYLFSLVEKKELLINTATYSETFLSNMSASYVDCISLINISVPIPYTVLMRHIIFFYLVTVPFIFASSYSTWYIILTAVGFISFVLFGIEEIGHMLEQPFGIDPTDLPLERFILTLKNDMQEVFEIAALKDNDFVNVELPKSPAMRHIKRNSVLGTSTDIKMDNLV